MKNDDMIPFSNFIFHQSAHHGDEGYCDSAVLRYTTLGYLPVQDMAGEDKSKLSKAPTVMVVWLG